MNPLTFVFMGRSGCGKGTQADLLRKIMADKYSSDEIFYLETGPNFRKFVEGDKYSNKLSEVIYKRGDRQPDFLAIWMWSHILLGDLKGNEHIVFDGICRSLPEAMVFTTAMEFYDRKPYIIHINVSHKWAEERLLSRKRSDDDSEGIRKRLEWFDKDVQPAIEYFNVHDRYVLLDINGEQSIEKVHADILEKLGW